jgi:enoyl-CoA hydratase
MSEQELLVELKDRVAVLTLNRPERRNALSTILLVSLAIRLEELQKDDRIRCVIIKGEGDKAFSAGMDLTSIPSGVPDKLLKQIEAKGPLQVACEAVEGSSLPVIAMIRGYALGGGCELSMACDLRVGSENSRIGMPPARLGIVYPPEGLSRFIRNIGLANAKKVFLTAKYFPAAEAYETGLLNYVVPDAELESFTMELAEEIAIKRAPLSIAGMKRALNILSKYEPPYQEEENEIYDLIGKALASKDAAEAMTAFREKRDPEFKGK